MKPQTETTNPNRTVLRDTFQTEQRKLWGLCYRITGNSADADDIVQDTFLRLAEQPPPDLERTPRAWLTRVAVNLARDSLRRRKRVQYTGPWLPSPVETSHVCPTDAEARYGTLESITMGFLLALELLSDLQRAVIVLRDVYGMSVAEAASALSVSSNNVKVAHHRARELMRDYDKDPVCPDAALRARTESAIGRLLHCLAANDRSGLLSLLHPDAVSRTDGGGEFLAALQPIVNSDRVSRFLVGISPPNRQRSVRPLLLNGLPGLFIEQPPSRPRMAPRGSLSIDVDSHGQIRSLYAVYNSRKLHQLITTTAPT